LPQPPLSVSPPPPLSLLLLPFSGGVS
jgi:hypothetical protein